MSCAWFRQKHCLAGSKRPSSIKTVRRINIVELGALAVQQLDPRFIESVTAQVCPAPSSVSGRRAKRSAQASQMPGANTEFALRGAEILREVNAA